MKKQLFNLRTMVIALGILFSGVANAFTAVTSGNWSSAATWGGVAPGTNVSGADIIIPAGLTVTLDQDVTFGGLLNQFQVNGTLSSSSMNRLTLNLGVLSGTGMISIRKVVFTNLATATYAGTMTVNEFMNSANTLAFVATLNISDSLHLDNGVLNINTNGNLSMLNSSTVKVKDGFLNLGGTGLFTTATAYNVMYMGTTKTAGVELNSNMVQHLYVKMNSNTDNVDLGANTTVNGNLNMASGRLNLNGRKLTVKGDITMVANTMLMSNAASELVVEGTGNLTSGLMFNSNATISSLTASRAGTVKLMSNLNVDNDLYLMNGTFSVESGAALTMNANSNVHMSSGATLASASGGTFVGTASYDVEYTGSVNTTAGMELSGSGLNDVMINFSNSGTSASLNNDVTVNGKLDMMNGSLALNGRNLMLNGTLSQNSNATFVGDVNSELHLNLTSAANTMLYFSSSNNIVSKLVLNVSGSADVMTGSMISIRNELKFVKGKIVLDNYDMVIMPTGSITGYSDNSYVVNTGVGGGRLQMHVTSGGSYVTFPVGTSANYSPAHIQQNAAGSTGPIMIRTMNEVYTGGYAGWNNAASSPVVSRTWLIDAASGSTVNMNMKLNWMAAAEVNSFNRNNAMIRHFVNGSWDTDVTAAATAGAFSSYELGRTNITSLSPFAISDANAAVSIKKNITSSIGFEVYPNPAKDVLILDLASTMQGYKYEVIDITGKSIKSGTTAQTSEMLDVSALKPGYYFVKVVNLDDNVSGVKRFVKD